MVFSFDVIHNSFDDKYGHHEGIQINITFEGYGGNFIAYQWIQVASQGPEKIVGDVTIPNPFIDGTFLGNGSETENSPFYNSNGDEQMNYYDHPSTTSLNGYFVGEATLVGINSNGQLEAIGSFKLGFSVTDGDFFPAPVVFSTSQSTDTQNIISRNNH